MQLNDRRVLVTGAGGFIGSHLAERLVELGARTRVFVHYNANGTKGWLDSSDKKDKIEFVSGDICDRDSVTRAVRGVDVVFHLAALIAIPYSYQSPASYVRTNIEGTLNVLQAARELGVEKTVHTSTSEVYGTAQYLPIDEGHPLQGQSPYAASKIGADKLVESFHLSFDVPVVTIRPFNTFGPRQSARAVIPTIATQCLRGDVVRLGNLHPTRDLNYVADTVDGFVRAASEDKAIGRTINIGSGKQIAIGVLAETIGRIVGRPVTVESQDERIRPEKSEVDRLMADNQLARELLGWQPQVSLENGLEQTVGWIENNIDRYPPEEYVI